MPSPRPSAWTRRARSPPDVGAKWASRCQRALTTPWSSWSSWSCSSGPTFRGDLSVAALVALAHDIVITIGVYALSGFEVTPTTVTGLLTILGFSLYDTVQYFDKVRENTRNLQQEQQDLRAASPTW